MQVYELARVNETYDLVWFMGGFLSSSLSFSRAQYSRAQGAAIDGFQTLTMPGKLMNGAGSDPSLEEREILLDEKWPKMAFVVGRLAHDPTNWRVPSASCVEAMLRSRRCVRPTNHCR